MENQLKRKYGLLMAMCMVVGTVIGSGIFFRNEEIITYVGGRMWIGVAAWALGGLITLAFAYVLATLATRHEKVGGLVDYSEAMLGKTYGYILGWFMATVFYPSMTGTLAWVSARFTVELFGWHNRAYPVGGQVISGETWALALFYLVMIYSINGLSPKLSEKFQVSGTFIKLVPLLIMGVVGTIAGLVNGVTLENLNFLPVSEIVGFGGRVVGEMSTVNAFFYALVATAFAYLGWDCVINLNSEIRDSKKNLPRALVAGSIIIMTVYVLYFLGIFGAAETATLATSGGAGTRAAFVELFSPIAGTILFVFIVCSCLGTLNGLTVATQRSFYAISMRNTGPNPELVSQVDKKTNVPNNSTIISMLLVAAWMVVIFLHTNNAFLSAYNDRALAAGREILNQPILPWFSLNVTNLVPIVFNALFFPLYIAVMVRQTDFGVFNRFIAPFLAAAGAAFFMFAVWFRERNSTFVFIIVSAVLSIIGLLFTYGKGKDKMAGVKAAIYVLIGIIVAMLFALGIIQAAAVIVWGAIVALWDVIVNIF